MNRAEIAAVAHQDFYLQWMFLCILFLSCSGHYSFRKKVEMMDHMMDFTIQVDITVGIKYG